YAFLTKITASFHHYRLKTIDMRVSFGFLAGAIPANIIVSVLVNSYKNSVENNTEKLAGFQSGLQTFISAVILLSAIMLIVNLFKKMKADKTQDDEMLADKPEKSNLSRFIMIIVFGVIVGGLIGATSIGGGVLIIPFLIIFVGLSPGKTVGTSIFVAVVLTLLTSAVYFKGGEIDMQTAVCMALGSTVGVYWGSKMSVKVPEKTLQGIVIGVIVISGIMMLLK
nr:sulfite exporter TauE/SafE family protein [PVC group bacterium]